MENLLPTACAASSIIWQPFLSAIFFISSNLQGNPPKWTGKISLVFFVIEFFAFLLFLIYKFKLKVINELKQFKKTGKLLDIGGGQGEFASYIERKGFNVTMQDNYSNYNGKIKFHSNLNNINIITAGNDGIDFMSSKSLLSNIHIAKTSDKSISVGENSNIHLKDSSIAKSSIGIAVKDDSFLNINNTIISSCSKGIFSYKKNWRFNNAGSIVSNNINFKNNDLDVHINETGKFYYNSDNSHNISIFGDGEFLIN